ncbi:hypothetical protein SteCoe_20522 [Stentor coeruleus]|uniref:Uncharacterized protein n=1 Tax=Stentor coeruleus TaxID=5963 RepID=A0A1R2BSA8_9CILI|nr:hypothetical protein SteCoe_20522 [Stentor coeruleus]
MCIDNPLCPVVDGSCSCGKSNIQVDLPSPLSMGFYPQDNANFMHSMFRMMMEQNEAIKSVFEQTRQVLDKLTKNPAPACKPQTVQEDSDRSETSKTGLLSYLCGPKPSFTHFLSLTEDLPTPLYKERPFSISLKISDSSGNPVTLPKPIVFKAFLYTSESPPKLVTTNTSGDKSMRGTLEVESVSNVLFRKIIIKEVTSHFRNGVLYFVVVPQNAEFIKPLIVEDFVVKARKLISKKMMKKVKSNEEQESQENCDGEEMEKE